MDRQMTGKTIFVLYAVCEMTMLARAPPPNTARNGYNLYGYLAVNRLKEQPWQPTPMQRKIAGREHDRTPDPQR
jgi:hypothetical protein